MTSEPVDVLVVGAGPTGLALAAELAAHGIRPRLVDRAHDRVHESRALAIQPRTLEVLARLGLAERLIGAGSPAVRFRLHTGDREIQVPLFDLGLADSAYPYLLFLSQAETERILSLHLARDGVVVERGVEFVGARTDGDAMIVALRHDDGREESVPVRYLVGCDGAHSAVRAAAGINFEGSSYPQTFVLVDLEVDGLTPDAAHVFLSDRGMLFFFPLGAPASWRLLAMRPPDEATRPSIDATPPGDQQPTETLAESRVELADVQRLADAFTAGRVRLRDPIWMTNFRLHHRFATHYRRGPIFVAGDAAHIHSPAGAQGMNTGIQDAVNLGWKLALTLRGANPALLDTYEPERAPVGRWVLRFTDRAFSAATSTNRVVRFARSRIGPVVVPTVLRPRFARRYVFRMVSQLAIRYRRSPLSRNGANAGRRGPRAGDRLPDAPIRNGGVETSLHALIATPGWHLLRCDKGVEAPAVQRPTGYVTTHHLSTAGQFDRDHLSAIALHRLGLTRDDEAMFLVRPDGYIGYRGASNDRAGLAEYLRLWLPAGDMPGPD